MPPRFSGCEICRVQPAEEMVEWKSFGDRSIASVLSDARSLSQRRVRRGSGRYWLEGVRHFVQAVDAGCRFEAVIVSPVLLKSDLAEMLARRLKTAGIPWFRITPEQFRSLSLADRASGIGAVAVQHWTNLDLVDPTRGRCWLVLETVRSPGNLGTILRTAEAIGVAGVLFVGPDCDPFDPKVLRASMGGVFHLALVRTTVDRLSRWLAQYDVHVIGLSPDAERLWTEIPCSGTCALVLGEERRGLSDQLRSLCGTTVRLPMTGRADSLNIGVAAGVMMYELVRRDGHPV